MVFIILFGALLLDQFSKCIAYALLQPQGVIPVVNNAFYLNYVENRDAAFAAGVNNVWILAPVAAIICIGVYYIYKTPYIMDTAKWGITLMIGGAFGNFLDSIRLGFVIDFFDLMIYPVFNLADIFITAGFSIMVLVLLLGNGLEDQA